MLRPVLVGEDYRTLERLAESTDELRQRLEPRGVIDLPRIDIELKLAGTEEVGADADSRNIQAKGERGPFAEQERFGSGVRNRGQARDQSPHRLMRSLPHEPVSARQGENQRVV